MLVALRAPYVPAFAPRRSVRSVVGLAPAPASSSSGTSSSALPAGAIECGCDETINFLIEVDAPRAAAMHEKGARKWSLPEWIAAWRGHLADEDEKVIPLARRVAEQLPGQAREPLDRDIGQIVADHATMEKGFVRGELPDAAFAARHAALEERLIARYGARMLRIYKAGGGGVRTTVGAPLASLDAPMFMVSKDASVSKFSTDNYGEKFMDPWVTRPGHTHLPDAGPDRDYLFALPADGGARVDAMIAKVAGAAGDTVVPTIEDLKRVGAILSQNIDAEALKTRGSIYRFWDSLADKAGGSTNIYVQLGVGALKWITSLVDLGHYGASGKAHALVEGSVGDAIVSLGEAMKKGYPFPWHALNLAPLDQKKLSESIAKTKDSLADAQKGIREVIDETDATKENLNELDLVAQSLSKNNKRFDTMGTLGMDVGIAIYWWTMLLSQLKDPGVARVFAAMHGGRWGGANMASDEQVLVIAAPIAKIWGIPLRQLAVELWNRSGGWNMSPAMLFGEWETGAMGDSPSDWCGKYEKGGTADKIEWKCLEVAKPRIVTNTCEVQWIQLAKNAILLADALKEGKPLPKDQRALIEQWKARTEGVGTGTKIVVGGLTLAAIVTLLLWVL